LWYADRVMSQFLVTAGMDAAFAGTSGPLPDGATTSSAGGLALVLGSGGVPLSALVAGALGWDVVMTDLEPVIELTRLNVKRCSGAVEQERQRRGLQDQPATLAVRELYFGDEQALDDALAAGGGLSGGAGTEARRRLLVLCSDCIWREFLHRPLLGTVACALSKCSGSAALVCFQTRSPQNEALFMKILREEFSCLQVDHLDATETLKEMHWPEQVLQGVGNLNLPESFPLLRLTLKAGLTPPPMTLAEAEEDIANRKPWWF